MKVDDTISQYFDTRWCEDDFRAAYKAAKGIEDRELTEEEEKDFKNKMTPELLRGFQRTVVEEVNERMIYLF